jgi:hypothetical protein
MTRKRSVASFVWLASMCFAHRARCAMLTSSAHERCEALVERPALLAK